MSRKVGRHLHVIDVEGRSWILIHPGTTYRAVVGWIMVGKGTGHVDADGRLDVTGSRAACAELCALIPGGGVWLEVYAPGEPTTSFREQHGELPSPSADRSETPARLAKGSSGDDVLTLQRALRTAGIYSGAMDDTFGPLTEATLKLFTAFGPGHPPRENSPRPR